MTARPDGLELAWYPAGGGGTVLLLPAMIGALIERAAAGEQISPAMARAMLLRMMRS